jgi:hypothetical protein
MERAPLQAELIEIDENLVRAELTPVEQTMHITKRKELYEKLHPETKQGNAPGAGKGRGKQASQKENLPFIINTARKTRRGRSTVAKAATRGKKVKVLADIAGTSLDGFGDLGGRSARRRPGSAAPGKRSPSSVAATASDGLLPSLQPPTIWCGCPS